MSPFQIAVPIPTERFLRLAKFLRDQGSERDPVQAVSDAVEYWIENASWKPDDLLPEIFQNGGYTWKEVFLRHGTMLRMKYKGSYHYAKVLGDKIIHEEKQCSPNQFTSAVTGTARDAWRDLEVRRPGTEDWVPASSLRTDKASGADFTLEDLGL